MRNLSRFTWFCIAFMVVCCAGAGVMVAVGMWSLAFIWLVFAAIVGWNVGENIAMDRKR